MELLYIAQHLRIPIAEVAVNWTEIEGRKIVYISCKIHYVSIQNKISEGLPIFYPVLIHTTFFPYKF